MKILSTVGMALCAAFIGTSAPAATILNGSFEDIGGQNLNGRGWNIFHSVPGWDGDPNIEIQSNSTLSSVNTPFGDRYAELDSNQNAGISQVISLDAGKYELSFWYSPRVNASPTTTNDMTFQIFNTFETLLDVTLTGAPNPAFPHGTFTQVTANFVTTGGDFLLSFAAEGEQRTAGCGDCGALIDNVQISAVPLPAGMMLLLTGLGALGIARRNSTI